mmetsp:Transcript_56752/g.124431  ORF Transcript_56752/g.124431 Transcript_56752/m.124431 type:complete len:164 (-) Transcript_56752:45-536(-)
MRSVLILLALAAAHLRAARDVDLDRDLDLDGEDLVASPAPAPLPTDPVVVNIEETRKLVKALIVANTKQMTAIGKVASKMTSLTTQLNKDSKQFHVCRMKLKSLREQQADNRGEWMSVPASSQLQTSSIHRQYSPDAVEKAQRLMESLQQEGKRLRQLEQMLE